MSNKIVFVTSGQPSANPRLVKEAILLSQNNFNVTVIYSTLSPWAEEFDKSLFARKPQINWINVANHSKKYFFGKLYKRLRNKFYQNLFILFGDYSNFAERSLVLYSQELKNATKKINAELYIGHNLGALPAIVYASKKYTKKAIFDFEDYYRGEFNSQMLHVSLATAIENKYIKDICHATAASPMIAEAYKMHFSFLPITVIHNYFPLAYATEKLNFKLKQNLSLFWFSQTVGKERGLEEAIEAIGILKNYKIKLTILGNCSAKIKKYFFKIADSHGVKPDVIHFQPPVEEKDIVKVATQHDIGLALESPHTLNREYCLTNKIFMYLLAGNAILFSNTKSQIEFLNQNPGIGSIVTYGDANSLASTLEIYFTDQTIILNQRHASLKLGQMLNWESECQKYLDLVNSILI